ncbi:MAG TPA: hypothetical protein VG271_15980 [Beijerinckiaceae bacterium]|jgi:hypothetical protein|nr:hypothetical protein [Beijerinckiaceae bacterium]
MAALHIVEAYCFCGLVCAVLFLLFGVTRALGYPTKVSAGARLILLPGAMLLWPVVLLRWLKSARRR